MSMNLPALAEIKARSEAAHRHICDLSAGKKKWEMCLPVQTTDSDMTLQAPLDDISRLISALELAIEQLGPCGCDKMAPRIREHRTCFVCEHIAAIARVLAGGE